MVGTLGLDDVYNAKIELWDTSTGRILKTLTEYTTPINSMCYSPDNRTLASAGGSYGMNNDSTIQLWDVIRGRILNTLIGHTGHVRAVCYSPDGTTLASGSVDGTIRLWDVATGTHLKTFTGRARYHQQYKLFTEWQDNCQRW